MEKQENQYTERVMKCPDGVYRWVYELNMYKNPIIFFTVVKVLLISAGIVFGFMALMSLISGDFSLPDAENMKIIVGVFFVFTGIVVLSYLIVAKQYGGHYIVLFEMDENQIVHMQMPSQFEKATAMAWLTTMAGLIAGNMAMVGLGVSNAVRSKMISEYQYVKKIIPQKHFHTIKVNCSLEHNQIYVCDDDYDFVLDYLKQHCRK